MAITSEAAQLAKTGVQWFSGHPPIDDFWLGPSVIGVPKHILLSKYRKDVLVWASVGIHNHSSRVIKDVRIKLPYAPDVSVDCRSGLPDQVWHFNSDLVEIQLPSLDPGEQANFELYSTPAFTQSGKASFIVEGRRISFRSKFLAMFHINSVGGRVLLGFTSLLLAATLGLSIKTWLDGKDYEHQRQLLSQAGYRSCHMTTLSKSAGTLTFNALAQHKVRGLTGVMEINGGRDIEGLLSRPEVLICDKIEDLAN